MIWLLAGFGHLFRDESVWYVSCEQSVCHFPQPNMFLNLYYESVLEQEE